MSSRGTHQPSPSSSDPPPPPPPPTHRRNSHPPQPHRPTDAVPRVAKELPGEGEEEEERDGTSYPGEEAERVSALSRGKAAHGVGEISSTSVERNRREKMNEMYMALQSMVPNLFPRLAQAPRAKIVEETISYVEELEGRIRVLEEAKKARKRARMRSTASSVDVTVSGRMAFFGVSSTWRPGLAARALQVFDNNHAEVLAATVAYDDCGQAGSRSQTMNLGVTAMADEAAVEGVEEELVTILS